MRSGYSIHCSQTYEWIKKHYIIENEASLVNALLFEMPKDKFIDNV